MACKKTNKDNRAIKYRIYPTSEQRVLFAKTFGCARFVYNKMLEFSNETYRNGDAATSRNDFNYRLTGLKREYPWLCEVDSTALTSANDHLADAFSNFFAKRANFPKFHKKGICESYTSKRIKNSNNIAIGNGCVRLPKLGKVKTKTHRTPRPDWTIKSATVSRDSNGRYYVAILFEFEKSDIAYVPDTYNAIGLDYASNGLYVDSNGEVGSNHRYFRESEKKLARQQRKLSRKKGSQKGEKKSENYLKQLAKVGKVHRHIANQRLDNLHKTSFEIANRYDVVCVETLNMKAMSNKGFHNGKSTMDNGYGMFLRLLEYKLSDRGKLLVKVDKWYPSSQLCHRCGLRHPEMRDLNIRTMECSCGLTMDRDRNAAINIRNEGLRMLREQV